MTEFQWAVSRIKRHLKDQKIHYSQLADFLKMSESGLKKFFAGEDGSFQRLAQIAAQLGLRMSDLVDPADPELRFEFTGPQQEAFLQDPSLFELYWRLVYQREAPPTEASGPENVRKLRKLDALRLLKLMPNGRVRVPKVQPVSWKYEGEFVKTLFRKWSTDLLSSTMGKTDERRFFTLRYFQMSERSFQEFRQSFAELEREFLNRAVREMRTARGPLTHTRFMICMDDRSPVGD